MPVRNWVLPAAGTFKSLAPTAGTPQKFAAVRVRVVRPFYALRRLLEVGEVVTLAEPDALDAIALQRAKRI